MRHRVISPEPLHQAYPDAVRLASVLPDAIDDLRAVDVTLEERRMRLPCAVRHDGSIRPRVRHVDDGVDLVGAERARAEHRGPGPRALPSSWALDPVQTPQA